MTAIVKREAEIVVPASNNPLRFMERAKPLPAELDGKVDLLSWARALLLGEKYSEPDPNYLNRKMVTIALNAEDLFSTTEESGVVKLQQWVTDVSGATTGPISIQGVYVVPSKLSDGNATYVILDVLNMSTGELVQVSTGATIVQGFVLKALALGMWPVDCQIKRVDRLDKGGRHVLSVFPID